MRDQRFNNSPRQLITFLISKIQSVKNIFIKHGLENEIEKKCISAFNCLPNDSLIHCPHTWAAEVRINLVKRSLEICSWSPTSTGSSLTSRNELRATDSFFFAKFSLTISLLSTPIVNFKHCILQTYDQFTTPFTLL